MAVRRALVLAGGGVAGIAWELGVLRGIADADPGLAAELVRADLIVGTSAGSTVAAQITSGTPLSALYEAQFAVDSPEIEVDFDLAALVEGFQRAGADAGSPLEARRRFGRLALDADTVPEAARRAVIAARLPVHDWPATPLILTAVDAETGELARFTNSGTVGLVDAVAASCAVPGVWPPVTIDGRRYLDGGMRSGSNADLAAGCDRVLVVTPTPAGQPSPWGGLDEEIAALAPARVHVIHADDASLAAFGTNPLSAVTRPGSARCGRTIGAAAAAEVAALWR